MTPIRPRIFLLTLCVLLAAAWAFAGGGPANVLVVVNARSAESLEIGNAYRRARALPYRNLLAIATATTYAVSPQVYLDEIETPIRAYLRNNQLDESVTCIVLTRGVPQMVLRDSPKSVAGLLASLGQDQVGSLSRRPNPYYGSEAPFSHQPPAQTGMYLVTVLTGYNTRDITRLIANGLAADGTVPDGRFFFQSSPQLPAATFEEAVRLLTQRGVPASAGAALPPERADVMGYFSGGIYSGLSPELLATLTFAPGALADMAQPYGAAAANLDESATPLLAAAGWLVSAGVTGLHAVVGDAGMETIPAAGRLPVVLDRYIAGFSLAESFYAALPSLNGQNVIIGDPLCAPYARRPAVLIENGDDPLHDTVTLKISAVSPDRGQSIERVDLYLDDRLYTTLYEPQRAVISLRVGDFVLEYPVPQGASLQALLNGLAAQINGHPELSKPDGVRALVSQATASLYLIARAPGAGGNGMPLAISIESEQRPTVDLRARLSGDHLAGGGEEPSPARGAISFLGRRIKPCDEVTVKIGPEKLVYAVPENGATVAALLQALADGINAAPALAGPGGVHAARDAQGMPVLQLEARTPGNAGNAIGYTVSVKNADGSTLRAYPETAARLMGGYDGSSASAQIAFTIGQSAVRRTFMLDTNKLCDGYHRLRAVAGDGSPAQVQGFADASILVKNLTKAPVVTLPEKLEPSAGDISVPVTAGETVKRVDLYIDGQLLGSADTAPFTIRLPLTTLGRGVHDLWAEGSDADGHLYRTAPMPLTVLAPPEILKVTPDHCGLTGGMTHRIVGSGFLPECTVRLAGVAAKKVTWLSPNVLEVVSDAGPARRGWVEVANPDSTVATLPNAFEYYVPRVANVQISPAHDILRPKQTTTFAAKCFDQFGHPIAATVLWDATGGTISQAGSFTAPAVTGQFVIRATHPDAPKGWDTPVTVGYEEAPDGVLKHWLVLGPFADDDNTGLGTALIPETTVQPAHGEKTANRAWHGLAAASPYVDFTGAFTPNTNAMAYAHVYLKSPAEVDCNLVFGSDDGVALWLNGESIYILRVRRPADPNQTTLPAHLRVGWNRLLVKVDQGAGGWGFFMRLQSRDGKPLAGILCALDNPNEPGR